MRIGFVTTLLLALVGCADPSPTRERFNVLFANAAQVRQGIDGDRYSSLCSVKRTESLADVRRLPNGLDRYRFTVQAVRDVGPCTYYCDVDPGSRTVVATKIDEVNNDCRASGWAYARDGRIIGGP